MPSFEAMKPLSPEGLCRRCLPAEFSFETTAELDGQAGFVGQHRAQTSLEFGAGIRRDGYNLFVMGPPGAGKHAMVGQYLRARAADEPKPNDWVYVNNFKRPHKPLAFELPPGRGSALAADMMRLIDDLRIAIPAIFESDEYRSRGEQIDADFSNRHEKAFGELAAEAATHTVTLLRTPSGFSLAPLKDGEVISTEDYEKLPLEERQRLETAIPMLQQKLEKLIRTSMQWRKERMEKIQQLNREMTLIAVGHSVEELKVRYQDIPKVLDYFNTVQEDIIDSVEEFRHANEPPANLPAMLAGPPSFHRYQVNLMMDSNGQQGSPVVFEDHPTYSNLIGRIDHLAQFGTLVTNFTLLKPGALHRASGGYLLLDAHKVLTQPGAWEGLKRALSTGCIRIESLAEMYSLASTVSLEPETIPLNVKVVLFGERQLYYALHTYDSDFKRLFKVGVDFEDEIERDHDNVQRFARVLATLQRREKLLPLDRSAVARLVEHSSRMTGDSRKLSGNIQAIADLLAEADHCARSHSARQVSTDEVQQAVDAQLQRADRVRDRMHESILRDTVMIDTAGAKVGQVNGLFVFEVGGFTFAEPARITATTRLGEGQLIDVQREVELGGSIHSKGVLILSSFLAAHYSSSKPHSMSASLVFEQTYGEVDGDSASLAELCALLSSLADAPIAQSFAVTGSVNQLGQVQAIGAVNDKIEGFFDICQRRGLSGKQGVLIPSSNVEDLMLRRDVVDAASAGHFHVIPVSHVDQAIEVLTGMPAGEPHALGGVESTINGRVAKRLSELTALHQSFAAGGKARRHHGGKKKDG
jgi:lon-related putative ATP-dependent protease